MARADYAAFVARKRPPKDRPHKYKTPAHKLPDPMPGPNAPDPKTVGVLPPKAARAGAYFLPGFGDVARAKNRRRSRQKHAFNPGPGQKDYS